MDRLKKLCLILCSILSIQVALAKGDIERGKAKSATCAACHSVDGNSFQGIWPKLAGQSEKYIVQQLQAFKKGQDGGRYDPSMSPLVAALSDQDMEDLAAYFSSQKTTIGTVDKSYVELGQAIYLGGNLKTGVSACSACHGPKGLGNNSAAFPRIGGQHPQYLMKQLNAFKEGTRTNGNSQIMQDIAKRMSAEEIKAVANFCYGLS